MAVGDMMMAGLDLTTVDLLLNLILKAVKCRLVFQDGNDNHRLKMKTDVLSIE
jgi:small nuclear ribonucleoprotein (snRNP)-like protein